MWFLNVAREKICPIIFVGEILFDVNLESFDFEKGEGGFSDGKQGSKYRDVFQKRASRERKISLRVSSRETTTIVTRSTLVFRINKFGTLPFQFRTLLLFRDCQKIRRNRIDFTQCFDLLFFFLSSNRLSISVLLSFDSRFRMSRMSGDDFPAERQIYFSPVRVYGQRLVSSHFRLTER